MTTPSYPYEVPKPGEPQCEADGVRNGPDGPGGTDHYWTCTAPGTVDVHGALMCEDHAGELGHGPKQEKHGYDPGSMGKPEGQASREAQIAYLAEWASRYGCCLQLSGEVGFGRECTGILKGDTYVDYADERIWTPEDAYHKHDCLAVLGRGDGPLEQLYRWVKWLDENRYGVEEIYRAPTSDIDLLFHGVSLLPRLVRLPS